MVKFSVIVPIYKVEKYLRQCIESVLNQTYANLELILVDDGSTDGCPAICDEYAAKDNRIIVVHKKNAGLPAARNSGIRLASGDYIMHLDGDDFWDIHTLEEAQKTVSKEQKALYLGNSRYDYIDGNARRAELYSTENLENCSYSELINLFFNGFNCIPTAAWHNIYQTKFIQSEQLYLDEKLTWSEDADNFYRVFFATTEIGFFDYTFYYYRKDNMGAMTKNPSAKSFLSNISVSKRWFHYVDESDFSVQDKAIIMKRFANNLMVSIKNINCLSNEDFEVVSNYILEDKRMLSYVDGGVNKTILLLATTIGPKLTSKLMNLLKR